ncbi:MAG: hypothetical protein IT337_06600 [Thermomicrobiales bacterium]|nr:hypothetical protein [Thermomicrobiales bacterium]
MSERDFEIGRDAVARSAGSTSGGGIRSETDGEFGLADVDQRLLAGDADAEAPREGAVDSVVGEIRHVAASAADTVKERAATVGAKAEAAAGKGRDQAAEGLHHVADALRATSSKSGEPERVSSTKRAVASRLDDASQRLESTTAGDIGAGLDAMVRRHPQRSLLMAAGLGFLLARAVR